MLLVCELWGLQGNVPVAYGCVDISSCPGGVGRGQLVSLHALLCEFADVMDAQLFRQHQQTVLGWSLAFHAWLMSSRIRSGLRAGVPAGAPAEMRPCPACKAPSHDAMCLVYAVGECVE